jgi:hypothetical protein
MVCLLGGDAPIHHPHALSLAVLGLDLGQEVRQGLLVEGIAGKHLVGQGKAVRGHHQGDDHLHAIGAFVAAVTEFALTLLRGVALEIGAGQIVEQDVEAGIKEAAPALLKVGKQVLFVREEMIQTAIEGVTVGDRKVLTEQIAHRTVVVPMSMQAPFATRVDETVRHQRLEHIEPARPLAAGRQPRLPEGVQLQ